MHMNQENKRDSSTSQDPRVSVFGRWVRAAQREVALVYPRYLLAHAVAVALPQLTFNRTRTEVLRAGGLKIGRGSLVMGPIRVTGAGDRGNVLSIGSDCVITGHLHVDAGATVRIGNRVYIGHDVALLTVDHEIGPSEQRCAGHDPLPIVIGDGVWIGSRVMILPGVTVADGAVIAAGAVVTRDVPCDTLVAGVPAQVVRALEPTAPVSTRKRKHGAGSVAVGQWPAIERTDGMHETKT